MTLVPTSDVKDAITAVECYDCVVPLPRSLLIGRAVVSARSYCVVRIRTEEGLVGVAYAFGRGLPLAPIVRQSLQPLLVGADLSMPEALRERLSSAFWQYGRGGLLCAALSAVDLALWDIAGKRLNAPLAELLGIRRRTMPACLVTGYRTEGEDDLIALEKEIGELVDRGARSFKVTIGVDDARHDARRLALIREVAGDDARIAVDAFQSFGSLDEAVTRLRLLEPYRLAYLEDPFPDHLISLCAELRQRTVVPLALGETVSDHRAYSQMIATGRVDVVRCDATVVGGVREFMATAALASSFGLPVATHVHQEIHVHFGAAIPNFYDGGLEYVVPTSGVDALHQLVLRELEMHDGMVALPDRPGLGLEFDWEAVERFAVG